MIRVIIVDDSPAIRTYLRMMFARTTDFQVVGEAADGATAVALARQLRPNLITMDLEMPQMSGVDAIREITSIYHVPIVVLSKASQINAEAYKALVAGAVDVLPAPRIDAQGSRGIVELLHILREIVQVAPPPVATTQRGARFGEPRGMPKIIVVGSSAGGPAALWAFLQALASPFPVPIVVAQHISAGFLGPLLEWLGSGPHKPVEVPLSGLVMGPCIYFAPPDHDAVVTAGQRIRVMQPDASTSHPNVDRLFGSAAVAYGASTLGIILSGMGSDGVSGCRAISEAGGEIMVQTPGTAAAIGMPSAALAAGLLVTCATLQEMAQALHQRL